MKNSGEMKTGLLFKISVWDCSVLHSVSEMPGSNTEAAVVPRCLEATERTGSYKRENGKDWSPVCQKERMLRGVKEETYLQTLPCLSMFGGGIVPL